MNKASREYLNDLYRFVGLFILSIAGLLATGLLLYGLLGYIDDTPHNPQRIVSTLLVMLLPVAYLIGRRESRAHRDGVERGITLKVGAQQRQPAPARILPASGGSQPTWQALVPPPAADIPIRDAQTDNVIIL